jgi:hypothetical protein
MFILLSFGADSTHDRLCGFDSHPGFVYCDFHPSLGNHSFADGFDDCPSSQQDIPLPTILECVVMLIIF